MKKIIISLFVCLLIKATLVYADDIVKTGIHLSQPTNTENTLKTWKIRSNIDGKKTTITEQQWGVVNLSTGDYEVQINLDNQTINYPKMIQVSENSITKIALDSGINLDISLKDIEIVSWSVFSTETKKRVATVQKNYGRTYLPAGSYYVEIRLKNHTTITRQDIQVKEKEFTLIDSNSGILFKEPSNDLFKASKWRLIDKNNRKNNVTYYISSGMMIANPGNYLLQVELPGQSFIDYREVVLKKGEIVPISLNTGVHVEGLDELNLLRWSLYHAETNKHITSIRNRWGYAAAAPGKYKIKLTLKTLSGQVTVNYGNLTVVNQKVNQLHVNAGILFNVDNTKDLKKVSIYKQESLEEVYSNKVFPELLPVPPGQYTVIAQTQTSRVWSDPINVSVTSKTPFNVTEFLSPSIANAPLLNPNQQIKGFNVASVQLGGHVESFSSETDNPLMAANTLNDGFSLLPNHNNRSKCEKSCGWLSAKKSYHPHEFVMSFHEQRPALLKSIIIDTRSDINDKNNSKSLPKEIAILVSDNNEPDDFRQVMTTSLQQRTDQHYIELPQNISAKYVKLRIMSTYGADQVSIGEVKIIEDEQTHSILTDVPKDLLRPENGGVIARFTSQHTSNQAAQLIWHSDKTWGGYWHSSKSAYGDSNYMPQDSVFAFHQDQVALIDHLIIDTQPIAKKKSAVQAKTISISVSLTSPVDDFQEVGRFEIEKNKASQIFKLNQPARFLKLRIIDTHGQGKITTLGKVKVIESNAKDYTSILRENSPYVATNRLAQTSDDPTLKDVLSESEPNDAIAQASPLTLDTWTQGRIDPLGETDYFKLFVDTADEAMLTIAVKGHPFIRSSLLFMDETSNELHRLEPEGLSKQSTAFSLAVKPGNYVARMTQPTNSIVLIWDSSGSMKNDTDNLQTAVTNFIQQVKPSEKLSLINFNRSVQVLTPEFSNNIDELQRATDGHFTANGGTSFYDAIEKGMDLLSRESGNKAIVVMTDGQDTGSSLKPSALWKKIEEKPIRIYTVGLGHSLTDYSRTFGSNGRRFLNHVAIATNGRSFYTTDGAKLTDLYQQVADELRSTSSYAIKPTVSYAEGLLNIKATGKLTEETIASNFELILDGSGSMKNRNHLINDRLKIDVAKDILTELTDELPESSNIALRVFGNKIKEYDEGDCVDSELLYALDNKNKTDIKTAINNITVDNGTTPLSYSLVQAAKDLVNVKGEKLIVLITDGEEYCGADPLKVAQALTDLGIELRINIVGMALKNKRVKDQMASIAETTGGVFYDANTTSSLSSKIKATLGASFDVIDATGNILATGNINGQSIKLPEGFFTVTINTSDSPITIPNVSIKSDKLTTVDINKQGQYIEKEISAPSDATAEDWRNASSGTAKIETIKQEPIGDKKLLQALVELEKEVLEAVVNRP